MSGSVSNVSRLASDPILLSVPSCPPGIGTVITSVAGGGLIDGVVLEPLTLWPDDRGYFFEVARLGRGLVARFPPETLQVSATFSYPDTVKAFHYHLHQTDCWTPSTGMLQVALVDLREQSATFGARNTLYVGHLRPWQILIPPGVAHGYKVIGTGMAGVIYVTDRIYDPNDERRLPYNDHRINYDWERQHK
jgi:dTDP-4-dehydrorhamnose 3,5-epimerase